MNRIVFVCSTRDFHAIDWYKSAKNICKIDPYVITDSKSSEGFSNLVNDHENVFNLFIIDKFLFKKLSLLGNLWRNFVKLIFMPLQIFLLKKFAAKYPNNFYYAHSMYYIWICFFAKVKYVATPQGSEILVRTYKSLVYKYLSSISLKSALFVTCDSEKMANRIYEISNIKPLLIQNGLDIDLLKKSLNKNQELKRKNAVVSFRGLYPLYRVDEIFLSRKLIKEYKSIPIKLIYPFYESNYRNKLFSKFKDIDEDIGKVNKINLYREFSRYLLYISIPKSDSSPRSVYECILCGGVVAITEESYYYKLPNLMKQRVILVNLNDKKWLNKAIEKAKLINKKNFDITKIDLNEFDQLNSFKIIYKKLHNISKASEIYKQQITS